MTSGLPGPATSLRELALLFLKLGATAFGGPAAHIAMMREEVVARRGWLTDEGFLDLVGAASLIPGPNSTELAIHVGWARRRFPGLLVAGASFIVPAMLMTSILGWAYVRYGAVPSATWLLYGVKPVVIGIVVQAIWIFAPKATRTAGLGLLAALAALLALLGADEILVLLGAGIAAMLAVVRGPGRGTVASLAFVPLVPAASGSVLPAAPSLAALFFIFLKIGSVLFGSGYVLLAFLRTDLVERLGWLSEAELIDAIAVGQVTPGPVFTTATFIGYVLAGPAGALAATAGIFLPAFVFVAASGPFVPRIRASRAAGAFLDGVNAASVALMAAVTLELVRAAIVDLPTLLLGLASGLVLVRYRPNATWLVLGGAAAGWALHAAGVAGG